MKISKTTITKAITALLVVTLAATGTVPSVTSKGREAQAQSSWVVFDNPKWGPHGVGVHQKGWRAGDPDSRFGYGVDRYGADASGLPYSNYIYASSDNSWIPEDSWAEWKLSDGPLNGTHEIQVYIPSRHAHAITHYWIAHRQDQGSFFQKSPKIIQGLNRNWVSLGEYEFEDSYDVTVILNYDYVTPYHGRDSIAADAIRVRCVSCSHTQNNVDTTVRSRPPRVQGLRVNPGNERISLSWTAPPSKYQVSNYDVSIRRRYDSGRTSNWGYFQSNSPSFVWAEATNGQVYDVRARAKNRYGIGDWSLISSGAASSMRLHIVDEPKVTGNFSSFENFRCKVRVGAPKYCWKRYRTHTDTYWYRSKSSPNILNRWSQANDVWGTNGFQVTRLERGKHRLATWNFDDVSGDWYDVQIYVPDVQKGRSNEYDFQPGALAKYVVSYTSTDGRWRTIQKNVDQSRYNDAGGQWVTLGRISVKDGKKVRVRVGSYAISSLGVRQSVPSVQSGWDSWRANLAVDAARLVPVSRVYGESWQVKEAQKWCVTDTVLKIFLDPFTRVLREKLEDLLTEAAVQAAFAAIRAAVGSAAGPAGTVLGAVVAVTRAGILIKKLDSVWDAIGIIRKIVRVIGWIKDNVIDRVAAIQELSSIVSEVGDIIVNPQDEERVATDLAKLCDREEVWENYYGKQRFWDKFKLELLRVLDKILDWILRSLPSS